MGFLVNSPVEENPKEVPVTDVILQNIVNKAAELNSVQQVQEY